MRVNTPPPGRFLRSYYFSCNIGLTLGFSTMAPNPECPSVNIVLMIQSLLQVHSKFLVEGHEGPGTTQ